MRPSAAASALLTCCLFLAPGCARSRTFTIYSKPADARLVINGVERGPGPITQRFNFGGSSSAARVTAVREGYLPRTQRLTANTPQDTVVIELKAIERKPTGRKVVVSVEPAAILRVNGDLVGPTPVRQHEIPLDPANPDKIYTVTAEQTGYAREVRTISGKDPQGYYRIVLKSLRADDGAQVRDSRPQDRLVPQTGPTTTDSTQARVSTRPVPGNGESPVVRTNPPAPVRAMRRDITIRTDPAAPGAEIYIDGEMRGNREVQLDAHEFTRDAAGKSVPQPISAVAPGFEGGRAAMRWEDNKSVYVIPLGRRRKEVRITTEPPGATVTLNGKALPKDRDGVSYDTVFFPPEDPPHRPTTLTGTVSPPDASGTYEPSQVAIRWDDGRKDYAVTLAPSRYVKIPLLQVTPTYDEKVGWRALGVRVDTVAARDPTEVRGRPAPQPLVELPAGTMLDSVIASPNGTLLLYTELIAPQGGGPLRAQMRLLNTDGTAGASLPSDGRHFDAMPSFTSDGREIVFTSDRSGKGLDVWKAMPGGGVEQLARGGEKAALWPVIDASPGPRLFYESLMRSTVPPADGRAAATRSEVHMVDLGSETKRSLSAGTRPRASPRADAIVFTRADPVTGKRDLFMISDKDGAAFAGQPVNLTRSPDADDCDPAWSRTGGKIAYASDAGTDETNRRNYDVYVLSVSDPANPVRVTHNGSHDDSPAWDPSGRSVYVRSNRGGNWGIWKVAVP